MRVSDELLTRRLASAAAFSALDVGRGALGAADYFAACTRIEEELEALDDSVPERMWTIAAKRAWPEFDGAGLDCLTELMLELPSDLVVEAWF